MTERIMIMDIFHFTCKYFKGLMNIKQYDLIINNNYTGFVFKKSLCNNQKDKRFIMKKGNIRDRAHKFPISDSTNKCFGSSQGWITKVTGQFKLNF